MKQWDVIYEYCNDHETCLDHGYYRVAPQNKKSILSLLSNSYKVSMRQLFGFVLLAIGLGGILGPLVPTIRLETAFALKQAQSEVLSAQIEAMPPLPTSVPVVFQPLLSPSGEVITPINEDFAIIVPKVGINATVIPAVNPARADEYTQALKTGVAHASTSFYPDEDGTVYLFSHSTNYDWFVDDLNAVFYLLKNLEKDDTVVLIFEGRRYTYKITNKRVVSPKDTSYLYPHVGMRSLILQTCWPPGSTTQRLLIFADLIEEQGKTI